MKSYRACASILNYSFYSFFTLNHFRFANNINAFYSTSHTSLSCFKPKHLRLNAVQVRKLTTCSLPNIKLNPSFITGFIDGEGSFILAISIDNKRSNVLKIYPEFAVELHLKDIMLLKHIESFFGVGTIRLDNKRRVASYRVKSIEALNNYIIPHFDKHPLLTKKRADFVLFKSAIELMIRKEHLTEKGCRRLVAIKASINKGLSGALKEAYSEIIPVERPKVELATTIDPNRLAGFANAEGCYCVSIQNSLSSKLKKRVKLIFQLTQHSRDEQLMVNIVKFLDCGNIFKNGNALDLIVTKFFDLTEKIIPFFQKYQIEGVKSYDFEDFCKAAEIIKNKAHLTQEGLEEIRKIKAGMNTGRK